MWRAPPALSLPRGGGEAVRDGSLCTRPGPAGGKGRGHRVVILPCPAGGGTGRGSPPSQIFSAGMICFLRLTIPGRTTVSPATWQPKDASAIRFTKSFGTSSVASSFTMSTTKSMT